MTKTLNAKKAHRGSKKKRDHNLFWKKRIKVAQKSLLSVIKWSGEKTEPMKTLQSVLDKAANNKVIHKNKAARLKSRYSKKLALAK